MNIFSRENSSVLRGLAILAIMFHNYLHLFCRYFCLSSNRKGSVVGAVRSFQSSLDNHSFVLCLNPFGSLLL